MQSLRLSWENVFGAFSADNLAEMLPCGALPWTCHSGITVWSSA